MPTVSILRRAVKLLKRLPLDFGQYELRYTTKGKVIANELIPQAGRALDVGCRDGYWAERLKKKGFDVVACDIEPHYSGALSVDANKALPFTDNQFDLIWCTEVIEHLISPVFTSNEFKRVLRPGGTLIMTTPNRGFWIFRIIAWLGIPMAQIENEEHHHLLSYSDMRNMLGRCDFYGYFPYLLVKFCIRGTAPLLSPTIVLRHFNDKRESGEYLENHV